MQVKIDDKKVRHEHLPKIKLFFDELFMEDLELSLCRAPTTGEIIIKLK